MAFSRARASLINTCPLLAFSMARASLINTYPVLVFSMARALLINTCPVLAFSRARASPTVICPRLARVLLAPHWLFFLSLLGFDSFISLFEFSSIMDSQPVENSLVGCDGNWKNIP